jgi:phosphoglycerol transferase MdoB-like AlkP superfamily enzyme
VQQSTAYFSSVDAVNQGTVNAIWNLANSIRVHLREAPVRGFDVFDPATARRLADQFLHADGPRAVPPLLVPGRPNIVLVILESWSSALVEGANGHQPAAPAFLQMAERGLTFTRHYATGTLSNHGLGAILSGVPSTPLSAWVSQPDLYPRLPHLGRDLARAGFDTRFVFGGDLTYGNIRAYLRHGGFVRLVEDADFAAPVPRGRLGVHDEHLWTRVLSEASGAREPFFIAAYTLSSHPPYDQPGPRPFLPDRQANRMRNATAYADRSLAHFMTAARGQAWYGRTLFVFVADHHARERLEMPPDSPGQRRVPLALAGPALAPAYRGVRISRVVAQYDLAALLLGELGLPHDEYRWSRHPLTTAGAELALFRVEGGFGWVTATAQGVYRSGAPSTGPTPPPAMTALFQELIRAYR